MGICDEILDGHQLLGYNDCQRNAIRYQARGVRQKESGKKSQGKGFMQKDLGNFHYQRRACLMSKSLLILQRLCKRMVLLRHSGSLHLNISSFPSPYQQSLTHVSTSPLLHKSPLDHQQASKASVAQRSPRQRLHPSSRGLQKVETHQPQRSSGGNPASIPAALSSSKVTPGSFPRSSSPSSIRSRDP